MKLDQDCLEKLGKVLVLGCGGKMGHHYIEKLFNLGFEPADIIGVDIDPINLQNVQEKFPGPFYTESHLKAINKKPNFAIVSVNSTQHLKEIERCYASGIDFIFCEKPLVYDFKELEVLKKLDNDTLITAYLINFSQIVMTLLDFAKNNNLAVTQVFSIWGKNWPGEKRVMGGDAEEEMMHPLALGDMIIKSLQLVKSIDVVSRMSTIPHVQPEFLNEIAKLEVFFPDAMNDSTLASYQYHTDFGNPWHFIISSFNLSEQQREVSFLFNHPDDFDKKGNPKVPPRYKARLIFDLRPVDALRSLKAFIDPEYFININNLDETLVELIKKMPWRDVLRIKDARENLIIHEEKSTVDKLQSMLKTALEAFVTDKINPRLVFFKQSSELMYLVHEAITSATKL